MTRYIDVNDLSYLVSQKGLQTCITEMADYIRADYLRWAVACFRLSSAGVRDETQIHTHMCYSEFNDIIDAIAAMDADVISIETARSRMELLEAFAAVSDDHAAAVPCPVRPSRRAAGAAARPIRRAPPP